MNDIVDQLRRFSTKINQLFGMLLMMKIPAELREVLVDDSPDLAVRAADEIVRLRTELATLRTSEEKGL